MYSGGDHFWIRTFTFKGKIPRVKEWQKRTHDMAHKGFTQGDNVGIITGAASGIFVVDIDNKEGGVEEYRKWVTEHGEFYTPTVHTGSGGYHLYFKYEPKLSHIKSNSKVCKDENLDPWE